MHQADSMTSELYTLASTQRGKVKREWVRGEQPVWVLLLLAADFPAVVGENCAHGDAHGLADVASATF
jgi:hypothetical protein